MIGVVLALAVVVAALVGWAVVRGRSRRPLGDIQQAERLLRRADQDRAAGRTERARKQYEALTARLRLPGTPARLGAVRGRALLALGAIAAGQGRRDAALDAYRQASGLVELPLEVLREVAEADAAAARQTPDADLGRCVAYLAALPPEQADQGPVAALLRERTLAGPGPAGASEAELRRAVQLAERITAAAPALEWAVAARARALHALGRTVAAEQVLRAAAEAGGSAQLRHRLGCVLLAAGRREEAVAAFDAAERRPAEPPRPGQLPPEAGLGAEIALLRGTARRELGDLTGARTDLDAAVAAAPSDPRTHYARGLLAVAEDDLAGARASFEAAVAADPAFAPARFGLGLLAERAGDPAAAAAAYREGLAGRGDWRPARVRLGAALVAAGRPAEGVAVLREELTGGPDADPAARFHCGLGHALLGEYREAAALWEALPGADDDPALVRILSAARDRLAREALAAGEYAAARELWARCAEAEPQHPGHRAALAEAALRQGAAELVARRDAAEQARRVLETARSLAPDDPRPVRWLAAAQLLGGDPAATATTLQSSTAAAAGPRARRLLAVALYGRGRIPAAVAALAALAEGGVPPDPARHFLGGLLAARAGAWPDALAAYRACLQPDGGEGTATRPGEVCGAGECLEAALARCGQCGRAHCAAHGARAGGAARCATCLDAVLAAAALAAHRAGTADAGERLLAPWAEEGRWPGAAHQLALLRAERGDLAGALECLGPPPEAGARTASPAGPALRARLHLRRAHALAADGALEQATAEIVQAHRADPGNALARRARLLVRGWEAQAETRAGRHDQALAVWRELWDERPTDPVLAHAVGLAAYRCAAPRPEPASGDGAPAVLWRLVIACWAAALYSPGFWSGLAERSGRAAQPEQITAARAAMAERIRQDLRAWESRPAAGEPAPEAAAGGSVVGDLEISWGLELQTAEEMAAATAGDRLPAGWPAGFACGPLLLELARAAAPETVPEAALHTALTQRTGRFPVKPRLLVLLSEWGRQRHLIDKGYLDQAVAELTARGARGSDPEAGTLLLEALQRRGTELHRQGDWPGTVDAFERLAAEGGDLARYADLVGEAGVRAARQILDADPEDYAAAVALLERARKLAPGHTQLRENLGAGYAQLARQVNNRGEFQEAIRLLGTALEHAPDDLTARHFARVARANEAGRLMEPENPGDAAMRRAEQLLREACALDPDHDTELLLGAVLARRAVGAAVAGQQAQALTLMTEAVRLDGDHPDGPAAEAARRLAVFLHNQAVPLMAESRYGEAIALLEKAIALLDVAEVREMLALALHNEAVRIANQGGIEQAVPYFKRALAVQDSRGTREQLAICLGQSAVRKAARYAHQDARRDVEEALRYDPLNRDLLLLRQRLTRR